MGGKSADIVIYYTAFTDFAQRGKESSLQAILPTSVVLRISLAAMQLCQYRLLHTRSFSNTLEGRAALQKCYK